MSDQANSGDPMDFLKNLWGNMGFSLPGMVAPTLDVEDLDKRIDDLKTVEGWLRMNLSMLQMTIQGLEMQRTTVAAVRTMSQMATQEGAGSGGADMLSQAAMWPWTLMQQMQAQTQAQTQEPAAPTPASEAGGAKKPARKPRKT